MTFYKVEDFENNVVVGEGTIQSLDTVVNINTDYYTGNDNFGINLGDISSITLNSTDTIYLTNVTPYKYAEDRIIADFKKYIDNTYQQHYKTEDQTVECFDAWIALGDSTPTFRNTALKYLWRYGKKKGSNKDDLMKTLHYVLMCLYVDHYKKGD